MSVIYLRNHRLKRQKVKITKNQHNHHSECLEEQTVQDMTNVIEEKVLLQASDRIAKIISFKHFLQLKHSLHTENIKLRNGLVRKIHRLKLKAIGALSTLEESNQASFSVSRIEQATDYCLELASAYVDYILYVEANTLELLNKYWEYKNSLREKLDEYKLIIHD
ncbi:MAG: hypothetical protein SFT81_03535 [Candidatus Caenarcaniphilales bacterium]|nr:hypothetical protein [Candidatus Caenarcaniphilales bacterium]